MSDSLAISRYAHALLNLSEERGDLDETARVFSQVRQAVEKHPEISHLLLNSTVSREEKEDFVEKVFPSPAQKTVVQFLKVLVKKNRFKLVCEIEQKFYKLYEALKGIKQVTVISAVPLSERNENKLRLNLRDILKAEINLIQKVDEKLIGGLIVRFDGNEVNGSYLHRLQEIKQTLLA